MFTNPTLRYIEDNIEKKYSPLFTALKKKWNQKIREAHRKNISVGSGSEKFPVTFKTILDTDESKFKKIFDQKYKDLNLFKLNAYKRFKIIAEEINNERFFDAPYDKDLRKELDHVNKYIDRHNIDEIITDILQSSNNQICYDVLGSYHPGKHEVTLYYIPIITTSMLLGIYPEYLFVVILTHELAHGYHHLGTDVDDQIWNNFKTAKNELLEPLAQYYTWLFLNNLENEFKTTFKKLTAYQESYYSYHNAWINQYDKETIRNALVTTRRSMIPSLGDFEKSLLKFKQLLK